MPKLWALLLLMLSQAMFASIYTSIRQSQKYCVHLYTLNNKVTLDIYLFHMYYLCPEYLGCAEVVYDYCKFFSNFSYI